MEVVRVIEAAQRSLREGGVQVPIGSEVDVLSRLRDGDGAGPDGQKVDRAPAVLVDLTAASIDEREIRAMEA
jgi:hypothetical protein